MSKANGNLDEEAIVELGVELRQLELRNAGLRASHLPPPKPSRRAYWLSQASDPVLAMASRPFEPGTVGKLKAAT